MTSRSLPGMAQDEKITRSPALRSIAGCSAAGDAGDGGAGFALRAGAEHDDLVARQGLVFVLIEEGRDAFEHAELARDAGDAVHAPGPTSPPGGRPSGRRGRRR